MLFANNSASEQQVNELFENDKEIKSSSSNAAHNSDITVLSGDDFDDDYLELYDNIKPVSSLNSLAQQNARRTSSLLSNVLDNNGLSELIYETDLILCGLFSLESTIHESHGSNRELMNYFLSDVFDSCNLRYETNYYNMYNIIEFAETKSRPRREPSKSPINTLVHLLADNRVTTDYQEYDITPEEEEMLNIEADINKKMQIEYEESVYKIYVKMILAFQQKYDLTDRAIDKLNEHGYLILSCGILYHATAFVFRKIENTYNFYFINSGEGREYSKSSDYLIVSCEDNITETHLNYIISQIQLITSYGDLKLLYDLIINKYMLADEYLMKGLNDTIDIHYIQTSGSCTYHSLMYSYFLVNYFEENNVKNYVSDIAVCGAGNVMLCVSNFPNDLSEKHINNLKKFLIDLKHLRKYIGVEHNNRYDEYIRLILSYVKHDSNLYKIKYNFEKIQIHPETSYSELSPKLLIHMLNTDNLEYNKVKLSNLYLSYIERNRENKANKANALSFIQHKTLTETEKQILFYLSHSEFINKGIFKKEEINHYVISTGMTTMPLFKFIYNNIFINLSYDHHTHSDEQTALYKLVKNELKKYKEFITCILFIGITNDPQFRQKKTNYDSISLTQFKNNNTGNKFLYKSYRHFYHSECVSLFNLYVPLFKDSLTKMSIKEKAYSTILNWVKYNNGYIYENNFEYDNTIFYLVDLQQSSKQKLLSKQETLAEQTLKINKKLTKGLYLLNSTYAEIDEDICVYYKKQIRELKRQIINQIKNNIDLFISKLEKLLEMDIINFVKVFFFLFEINHVKYIEDNDEIKFRKLEPLISKKISEIESEENKTDESFIDNVLQKKLLEIIHIFFFGQPIKNDVLLEYQNILFDDSYTSNKNNIHWIFLFFLEYYHHIRDTNRTIASNKIDANIVKNLTLYDNTFDKNKCTQLEVTSGMFTKYTCYHNINNIIRYILVNDTNEFIVKLVRKVEYDGYIPTAIFNVKTKRTYDVLYDKSNIIFDSTNILYVTDKTNNYIFASHENIFNYFYDVNLSNGITADQIKNKDKFVLYKLNLLEDKIIIEDDNPNYIHAITDDISYFSNRLYYLSYEAYYNTHPIDYTSVNIYKDFKINYDDRYIQNKNDFVNSSVNIHGFNNFCGFIYDFLYKLLLEHEKEIDEHNKIIENQKYVESKNLIDKLSIGGNSRHIEKLQSFINMLTSLIINWNNMRTKLYLEDYDYNHAKMYSYFSDFFYYGICLFIFRKELEKIKESSFDYNEILNSMESMFYKFDKSKPLKSNELIGEIDIFNKPNKIKEFELYFEGIVKKSNIDIVDKIFKENTEPIKKIHNIIMGQGKTAVITPLLLERTFRESKNTINCGVIVLPATLTKQSFKIIVKYAGFLDKKILCNRNVDYLDNNILIISDVDFKHAICDSKKIGNIFSLRTNTESTVVIYDEFDSLINPYKSNFNYISNKKLFSELLDKDSSIQESIDSIIDIYFDELNRSSTFNPDTYEFKTSLNNYHISNKINSKLIYNYNYGFNEKLYAVPYNAVNSYSENTNFSDFLLCVVLTIKSFFHNYIINGYDFNEKSTKYLYSVFTRIDKEASTGNNPDYYPFNKEIFNELTKEKSYRVFKRNIRSYYGNKNFLKNCFRIIINHYISIIPIGTEYANASFLDICNSSLFHNKYGFSGTTENLDILKNIVYDDEKDNFNYNFYDVSPNETNYENEILAALSCTFNEDKKVYYIHDNINISDSLINTIIDGKFKAFIDVGAFLKYVNINKFVRKLGNTINNTNKYITYICYFNEDDTFTAYDINKEKFSDNIDTTKDDIFYLYDNKHIIGADIKQNIKVNGLISFKHDTTYTEIAQGAFRLRKLNRGHTINYVYKVRHKLILKAKKNYVYDKISLPACHAVRKSSIISSKECQPELFNNLITLFKNNEKSDVKRTNYKLTLLYQNLLYLIRRFKHDNFYSKSITRRMYNVHIKNNKIKNIYYKLYSDNKPYNTDDIYNLLDKNYKKYCYYITSMDDTEMEVVNKYISDTILNLSNILCSSYGIKGECLKNYAEILMGSLSNSMVEVDNETDNEIIKNTVDETERTFYCVHEEQPYIAGEIFITHSMKYFKDCVNNRNSAIITNNVYYNMNTQYDATLKISKPKQINITFYEQCNTNYYVFNYVNFECFLIPSVIFYSFLTNKYINNEVLIFMDTNNAMYIKNGRDVKNEPQYAALKIIKILAKVLYAKILTMDEFCICRTFLNDLIYLFINDKTINSSNYSDKIMNVILQMDMTKLNLKFKDMPYKDISAKYAYIIPLIFKNIDVYMQKSIDTFILIQNNEFKQYYGSDVKFVDRFVIRK